MERSFEIASFGRGFVPQREIFVENSAERSVTPPDLRSAKQISPEIDRRRGHHRLFKIEVIRRRGPWRNVDLVEYAIECGDWFNDRRLLEPLDQAARHAEFEAASYQQHGHAMAA